jgi:transcriptional regulator with XRE-family HTH domain
LSKSDHRAYCHRMTQLTVQGTIPVWTLTDRLRKAREDSGLSQTALGEAMGLSRRTVAGYEAGEREPKRHVQLAWALATGVSLDWLCPRQDSNLQPTDLWSAWGLAA